MSFNSSFIVRDVAEMIPPDEVLVWVKTFITGEYLGIVIATALVYDSGK